MKSTICLTVMVLVATSAAYAGRQDLTPIPDPGISGVVIHESQAFVDPASVAIPLYTNVRVKDRHEMAPCAQPKIIAVKDPCACDDPCDGCPTPCVYIEICVPTCGCELITCRRDGDRIRYDYGKYAVDVRVRRDHIVVDYQD